MRVVGIVTTTVVSFVAWFWPGLAACGAQEWHYTRKNEAHTIRCTLTFLAGPLGLLYVKLKGWTK